MQSGDVEPRRRSGSGGAFYGTLPGRYEVGRLESYLKTRPDEIQNCMRQQGLMRRLVRWVVSMSETGAFTGLRDIDLLVVLFEWVLEIAPQVECRLEKLELLLGELQQSDPDQEAGFKLVRKWVEAEMGNVPELLKKALTVLDRYDRWMKPGTGKRMGASE
jgi:hypothetical protein